MKELLNCTDCDHCCNYMTFTLQHRAMTDDMKEQLLEFYNARGAHITQDVYAFYVTIHSPCPHKTILRMGYDFRPGCDLHSTNKKPKACRVYDCRDDPFLPPGGNYKK